MSRRRRSAAGRSRPNPRPAVSTTVEDASVTHRGIRWQRGPKGGIRWWNDQEGAWVPWVRGADAPPRPIGWEARGAGGGPATNKAARAPWTSPYRLVPLGLFLAIVIAGVIQATTGSGGQAPAEATAAGKLAGHCLRQNGFAGGHPRYSAEAVGCSTPGASVKVVRVLPGTPGAAGCPVGEIDLTLPYAGVRYPHVECVVSVAHGG